MREKILSKLTEIEEKENVKILYCAEAGSRATGLSSEDSDYDVRFIYKRRLTDYLKLETVRDVIEWQCDDTLDISGWDIKKALTLGYRSNPSLFEWMSSPIVYKEAEEWKSVRDALMGYFSPLHTAMHYFSMAKSNYDGTFGRENLKFKKYFYMLRPLLSAEWVTSRRELPPLVFGELVEALPEGEVKSTVRELVTAKRNGSKKTEGKPIAILNQYVEDGLVRLDAAIRSLPEEERRDIKPLDDVFLSLLYTTSHVDE